ncbi:CCT motif [Musa troglodytarum]|uniref:CCT motif n=1 Tax=Musa troglodytarum TaxID=320322 RepID=A0A9E7FGV9_9LILI|nr:CCT motif [Musa troglodytarum]
MHSPRSMFRSSSSASFVDPELLPRSCCPTATHASDAATTRGNFDGNSPTFPPLLSPSPPYSSSAPSNYCLSRSSSSHSLPLHHHGFVHFHQLPFSSSLQSHCQQQQQPPSTLLTSPSPPSSSRNFVDLDARPVRHVLSTGNIQGMGGVLASGEKYNQEGREVVGRVGRYSAQERKERIERYRSKRNQRNFHKKITYACRKTLADCRPRVKGRFARNGDPEAEASQSSYVGNDSDWSREMQAELAADEGAKFFNDEDLWAVFSARVGSTRDVLESISHRQPLQFLTATFAACARVAVLTRGFRTVCLITRPATAALAVAAHVQPPAALRPPPSPLVACLWARTAGRTRLSQPAITPLTAVLVGAPTAVVVLVVPRATRRSRSRVVEPLRSWATSPPPSRAPINGALGGRQKVMGEEGRRKRRGNYITATAGWD